MIVKPIPHQHDPRFKYINGDARVLIQPKREKIGFVGHMLSLFARLLHQLVDLIPHGQCFGVGEVPVQYRLLQHTHMHNKNLSQAYLQTALTRDAHLVHAHYHMSLASPWLLPTYVADLIVFPLHKFCASLLSPGLQKVAFARLHVEPVFPISYTRIYQ
jgi:hypothetical protein